MGNYQEYAKSPVPADTDLWPEEKPFTAFGQHGEGQMDKRVFEQDVYWVNIKGEPFLLTEMSEEYRRNVISFLMEGAEYYHFGAVMRMLATLTGDAMLGRITYNGDVLAHSLGLPTVADLTADEWLESTPLMRRLRELTPEA